MNVISFAQMKGGTGKTTVSFNVACLLAETSKVLVVDFDPQCNMSSNFRFDIFDIEARSSADLFDNIETDPLDLIIPQPFEQLENLDIIPSTMYLYGTELLLSTRAYREQAMKTYMAKNKEVFSYYDYIIFDTSPSMGLINQNAFVVSDHIVLVLDPDCNSARGANVFLNLWDEARQYSSLPDHVDALIINNVERNNISAKTLEYIAQDERLSSIKLNTSIPHTVRFKECADQNIPITYLRVKKKDELSKKRAVNSIRELVDEMKERGVL